MSKTVFLSGRAVPKRQRKAYRVPSRVVKLHKPEPCVVYTGVQAALAIAEGNRAANR